MADAGLAFKERVLLSFRGIAAAWTPAGKRATMQALSSRFNKGDMGKVYSVLAAEYGAV